MHDFRDKNYWAIILGGSSGIGLATARMLAEKGMNLCILHRDRRSALGQIEAHFSLLETFGVKLIHFNQDALKPETRKEVLEKMVEQCGEVGSIRLLLHSIAKGNLNPMNPDEGVHKRLSEADFRITLLAMATSLWEWTQGILEFDLFATDARVIGLTSEGNQKVWPGYGAVSAAKSTLESLVRQMAVELAPLGIRANAVQAGVTDTPSLRMIPNADTLKERARERNPFQRLTLPEDVARVIYLLCTDEASWINGAVIPVDGGERLR